MLCMLMKYTLYRQIDRLSRLSVMFTFHLLMLYIFNIYNFVHYSNINKNKNIVLQ